MQQIKGQQLEEQGQSEFGHKGKGLASKDTAISQRKNSQKQSEEQFKLEHQKYIAKKLQERQKMLNKKKEYFGESSDEDEIKPPNNIGVTPLFIFEEKKVENPPHLLSPILRAPSEKSFHVYEKVEVQIPSKMNSNNWVEDRITIKEKVIVLGEDEISIYETNKIKIFFKSAEAEVKIKINQKEHEYFLSSSSNLMFQEKPIPFYIFAKILNEKLSMMGKVLEKFHNKKVHGVPEVILNNNLICGTLLKKSKFFGKWEERFMLVNKDGLYYYKKFTEKANLLIASESLSEMWTRFDLEEGLLVIKLAHNNSKTEIAIPLYNYLDKSGWLSYFYQLAFPSK